MIASESWNDLQNHVRVRSDLLAVTSEYQEDGERDERRERLRLNHSGRCRAAKNGFQIPGPTITSGGGLLHVISYRMN